MAIIKCKMCGGDIELTEDKTFGTCEFCGSSMTFPKLDDDQRAAAFNRGNHFRRIGEFDKALAVYERIVREDENDAEAHWCCALCRFGIEYVEDPATYEWLPTCHRASFDSFLEDVDYLAALEHSDGITKRQYQKDAAKIAEVQRGILATSQNEEPFDVFICYKESDENKERTQDSLLAQDIYYQLTDQGYRVFFSRITLEDMAGKQYEPYIFAALNSAKVMIVVGTKAEYLNAVWVKNEWSRFLAMMKKDRSKLLLPCYRDMDPYDMPEQLSVLQSYDMAKIGFLQDLIRGIKKVLDTEKQTPTVKETVVVQQTAAPATAPLLKRMFMFLEDGDWSSANEYAEKVLDIDPECAEAYVGKLMAELHVKKQEALQNQAEPFDSRNNYQKALRFGDASLKEALTGYIDHIKTRNENNRLEGIYRNAQTAMAKKTEQGYSEAARLFASIRQYKDAATLAPECKESAETLRLHGIYSRAKNYMAEKTEEGYLEAAKLFATIPQYKDASTLVSKCQEAAETTRLETIYVRASKSMAMAKSESHYIDVAKKFELIHTYKDSADLAKTCREKAESARKDDILISAKSYMNGKNIAHYESAMELFASIPGWKNADTLLVDCQKKIEEIKAERIEKEHRAELLRQEQKKRTTRSAIIGTILGLIICAAIAYVIILLTVIMPGKKYDAAVALMDAGKYDEAITAFAALDDYKDSKTQLKEAKYGQALALAEAGNYAEAIAAFEELRSYKDSPDQILEVKYTQAISLMDTKNYAEAIAAFEALGGYKDSADQILETKYRQASALADSGLNAEAVLAFGELEDYKDAKEQCAKLWDEIAVRETVSAGWAHTVAIKKDGTVVAVGSNDFGPCDVSGWKDIVAISAGSRHTVGLKKDGTVVAVGLNSNGQCNVSDWKNIVAICAGDSHTVGLKEDGTVVATGFNGKGQCDVSKWKNIVAICAGDSHTVGLKEDGTVVAVGSYEKGQRSVSGWTDIVAVAAGYFHTVGLKADGTVVAVGENDNGQLSVSGWTDIVAIGAGWDHTVGLKKDGTVVAVGYNEDGACDVSKWKNIVAIAVGSFHTVGLKQDGTAVSVGSNLYERRDVSTWKNIKTD